MLAQARQWTGLVLTVSAIWASAAPGAENLFPNAGFRRLDAKRGLPTGWHLYNPTHKATVEIDTKRFSAGRPIAVVQITTPERGWTTFHPQKPMAVEPDMLYELAFWHEELPGYDHPLHLSYDERDADGKKLNTNAYLDLGIQPTAVGTVYRRRLRTHPKARRFGLHIISRGKGVFRLAAPTLVKLPAPADPATEAVLASPLPTSPLVVRRGREGVAQVDLKVPVPAARYRYLVLNVDYDPAQGGGWSVGTASDGLWTLVPGIAGRGIVVVDRAAVPGGTAATGTLKFFLFPPAGQATLRSVTFSTLPPRATTPMPFRTYMTWHGFGGMAWYAVNRDGKPFSFTVYRRMEPPAKGRRTYAIPAHLIVRVHDPDDRELVFEDRRYETPCAARQTFDVPASKPGVYKIVVSGNRNTEPVGIGLPSGMRSAFMGCDILRTDQDVLRRVYLYVPRHVGTFGIDLARAGWSRAGAQRTLRVFDENDRAIGSATLEKPHNVVEITPAKKDVVYRLEVSGSGPYSLIFSGIPGILARDAETVRTVRAGAVYLDEGVTVQHAFLKPLWDELKAIRARDLTFRERPLQADAFLKDNPRKHTQLLGLYGPLSNLPVIAKLQNTDPKSRWFGSIDVWEEASKKSKADPRNPLAAFAQVSRWGAAGAMALAYTYKHPCNPYAGDRVLLDRAAAAIILNLLRLDESEVIIEQVGRTSANKWGGYHFFYLYNVVTPLWILRDALPKSVRDAWIAAAERIGQKHAYLHASATNQWTIPMLAHYLVGRLTGKAQYARLVDEHIDLLIGNAYKDYVGQSPGGFYRESTACDGGYNSMSVFYLSNLYYFTKDMRLLKSLRKSWELRGLMTVVEPDGRVLAATHFNSRTPSSFAHPFYPDAVLMDPFIDAASDYLRRVKVPKDKVHHITWNVARPDDVEASIRHWVGRKLTTKNRARTSGAGEMTVQLFEHIHGPARLLKVPLPCEMQRPFVRDVAGEFLVIKRPAYYTYLYTAPLAAEYYLKKVRQGGGLSLVWTPAMGVSLFGVNEDNRHHHAITGVGADGKEFTSCASRAETWDKSRLQDGQLTVAGRIPDTPLTFRRQYDFAGDSITVRLTVKAEKTFAAKACAEQLPFLGKPGLTTSWVDGTSLKPGEGRRATGWTWKAHAGTMAVAFDKEQAMSVDKDVAKAPQGPVRTIRVALPTQWAPGQKHVLTYRLVPKK